MLRVVGCVVLALALVMRGHGAQALTEEAPAAQLFVWRLGSLCGFALTDDGGAIGWIVEACKQKSVHNDGHGDVRRRSTRLNDFGWCEELQGASLGARQE